MDALFVGASYVTMLLAVIYGTRGQGKRSAIAIGGAVISLIAASYSGSKPDGVANHALILIIVGIGTTVMFAVSKRRK